MYYTAPLVAFNLQNGCKLRFDFNIFFCRPAVSLHEKLRTSWSKITLIVLSFTKISHIGDCNLIFQMIMCADIWIRGVTIVWLASFVSVFMLHSCLIGGHWRPHQGTCLHMNMLQCYPIEKCYLPKAPGRCSASSEKFHYNPESHECEKFVYGGCLGNANRFETSEECRAECAIPHKSGMIELLLSSLMSSSAG